MSDWSDFKEGMGSKANSPKGLAFIGIVYAIVAIILGVANIFLETHAGKMNQWGIATNFFILGMLLALSAAYLFKGSIYGYWIAWIGAIFAIVIGVLFLFFMDNSNVCGRYFVLAAGVIDAIILLIPSTREGLTKN